MTNAPIEWAVSDAAIDYPAALEAMQTRVLDIQAGNAPEMVWLLEHPPLYTAGTSARDTDLRAPGRFPVFDAGRGGQYTYHGPGQRVAYTMMDLNKRGRDVRQFVGQLEAWIIAALSAFNIDGEVRDGRVGGSARCVR